MKTLIDVGVPGLTFILLIAVGLDLTAGDFARLRRQPLLLISGLVTPVLLLPLIALALIEAFAPDPAVAAGLLLIAACPIGGISNTWSYLARASTALSVTLTGLSCLFAGATIPLIASGLALAADRPIEMPPPSAGLVARMLVTLAVPVAAGMIVRRRWTSVADRWRPSLQRVAFFGIAAILALVVLENPLAFAAEIRTTVPLASAFILCSMASGWAVAALVAPGRNDRFTIATEFATRNVGVATAIAVTLLGRVEFARFAATYFLTELPIMLAAVWIFVRRREESGRLTPPADSRTRARG